MLNKSSYLNVSACEGSPGPVVFLTVNCLIDSSWSGTESEKRLRRLELNWTPPAAGKYDAKLFCYNFVLQTPVTEKGHPSLSGGNLKEKVTVIVAVILDDVFYGRM